MFKSVSDSAAAADGGSLALFVERQDGQTEVFVIHRSLASRGTPDYNRITTSLRPLSADDRRGSRTAIDDHAINPSTGRFHRSLQTAVMILGKLILRETQSAEKT